MVDINVEDEYKPLINDLIKYSIMFIVINILMYLSNPSKNKLFNKSYVKIMIFALLGLATYWLVLDKLVVLN